MLYIHFRRKKTFLFSSSVSYLPNKPYFTVDRLTVDKNCHLVIIQIVAKFDFFLVQSNCSMVS